jgi:hypothetical protein
MSFYEFLEGLARVAEKISILPFEDNGFSLGKKKSLEERRMVDLDIKLEGLLLFIYYKLGK